MRMVRWLMLFVFLGGMGASMLISIIFGIVAEVLTFDDPSHGTQCANTPSCEIVYAATTLENHLKGVWENDYDLDPQTNRPIDPFLGPIFDYWKASCGGYICSDMQPGNVQCVEFVKGALFLAHQPPTDHPNAIDWWWDYAHKPGWQEIPADSAPPAERGLPEPGDLIIWDHGAFGHIAIVIAVGLPLNNKDGLVEVAQGNGPGNLYNGSDWPGNFYSMPLHPDLSVGTWAGYRVMGYIRQTTPRSPMPSNLANSPYVATATKDAQTIGIPPAYFTEQIQTESGYDPQFNQNGREGIAGFTAELASTIQPPVNPFDPNGALQTLSNLMVAYSNAYGGDYAAALAAYAFDQPSVQRCKTGHNPAWLACMPSDVQQYVLTIMFYP